MKKALLLWVFLLFLVTLESYSQERDFSLNGFRGLELEKASTEDVVKVLGLPTSRKSKINSSSEFSSKWWIDLEKFTSPEKLTYKNIGLYQAIDFFFVKDRLVALVTYFYHPGPAYQTPLTNCKDYKLLMPDDLNVFFGANFKPFNGRHFPETPKAFEKYTPRGFMRDEYMMQFYSMTAITEKTFVFAAINSIRPAHPGPACTILDRSALGLKPNYEEQFPGQVEKIYMFSRTLEKK